MLIKRLTKVGNSQGFLIDKAVLDVLGIGYDTDVQVTAENGALVLRPLRKDVRQASGGADERRARLRAAHDRVLAKHDATFRKLAE